MPAPPQDRYVPEQRITSYRTFHGWNHLPTEIKLEVLSWRLIFTKPLTLVSHPSHFRRALIPLALPNKAMRKIAYEVYYSRNCFELSSGKQRLVFYCPPPSIAHLLRHVIIDLNVVMGGNLNNVFCTLQYGHDWKFLLRPDDEAEARKRKPVSQPRQAEWTAEAAKWQDGVSGLKKLEFRVFVIGDTKEHLVSSVKGQV